MTCTPRIDVRKAQLLVVDIQQKLLPHIDRHELVVSQTVRMIRAALLLELPITLTEQYPAGLGRTHPDVRVAADNALLLEKMTFSVLRDEEARAHLTGLGRPHVLLAGIETHVCVQQTALDLLDSQMTPFLLADAIGSRRALDRDTALERMRAGGLGVTTVEAAIFEMIERADTELFKRLLPIVR